MDCKLTGLERDIGGRGDLALLVRRGEGEVIELSTLQGRDVTMVLLG